MVETWKDFLVPERSSFRWNTHYKSGFEKVLKRYSRAQLRQIQYDSDQSIANAITDLSTSSGWTRIVTGLSKKSDLVSGSYVTFIAKRDEALRDGSFNAPVIPWYRTQCSGEFTEDGEETGVCKHKSRPIWMVDFYQMVAERSYAKPLTEWLKGYKYSAIGKDDRMINELINGLRLNSWSYISLDYSKYDATMPSWLIKSAFEIIESAFTSLDSGLLHVLCDDFIHKNLITRDGVLHVDHGDPSGSGFTSIVNGICNEIITETWADYLGVDKIGYIIMGDDNLIYTQRKVDMQSISSYITHNFGVKVNTDKSSFGSQYDDPEFLSRKWTSDGPYRHPSHLISLMCYPEKYRDYERNPGMTPELVMYSYVLGYFAGMRKLIDVDRFMTDMSLILARFEWNKVLLKEVPYNLRVAVENRGNYTPYIDPQMYKRGLRNTA
jgi:hypothetical protein